MKEALKLGGSNLGVDLSIDGRGCHSQDSGLPLPVMELGVEILDDASIRVILFGVVGFVKDQQVDLVHPNVRVGKALVEDFGSTDNGHVLVKSSVPEGLVR